MNGYELSKRILPNTLDVRRRTAKRTLGAQATDGTGMHFAKVGDG
jgi:hypothetical protein